MHIAKVFKTKCKACYNALKSWNLKFGTNASHLKIVLSSLKLVDLVYINALWKKYCTSFSQIF